MTGAALHVLALCMKWIFICCIPLQAMLWPTVTTICFVCIYGVINLLNYFATASVLKSLQSPGMWIYHCENKPANYALMLIFFVYFGMYFFQFLTLEAQMLPTRTFWLDPSIAANYTVQSLTDLPVEVTSDVSQSMRDTPFEWAHSIQAAAPLIHGAVTEKLLCGAAGGFRCYAKLWPAPAPHDTVAFVPFPNQFYDVDVRVKPGPGVACTALEVYRTVIDVNRNTLQPLDYPSSTIPNALNRQAVFPPPCKLFNGSSSLCLEVSHTFTTQQYAQEQASQCALYGQQLVFRLPSRAPDVDPESGRMALDILLVSDPTATVTLSANWKAQDATPKSSWFLASTFWRQVVDTDELQGWRESSEQAAVFFKFAIAATPALFTWYYLSVEFLEYISDSQILFLSIFIELPAIILFLSLGAWLPMAGCIVCVLAVNYDVTSNGTKPPRYWQGYIRPALLFLKAASNSIQFAWLLALVGQAGWNAFFYELTLQQLYQLSHHFIITYQSSPTWIALMLPIVLIVNFAFLLGSAICVVLETIVARHHTPAASAGVVVRP
jgi:hypothetical protein